MGRGANRPPEALLKVLVTGGGGFLGRILVDRLLTRGDAVRVMGRQEYPDLAARGVVCVKGDMADAAAVQRAVEGVEIVFHAGAKAGYWGDPEDYEKTNVVGTRNVLAACRQHGVKRLVYTSSPSVMAANRDHQGIDERHPYPGESLCEYQRTKILAEREVMAASRDGLLTVSLRPHLIFGPGDPHLAPRALARAREGKLKRVGDGSNRVDTIYVENAADAHLTAADRLEPGSALAGRAYFLSQGEPVKLWSFIGRVLEGFGAPPVRGAVPFWLAWHMGRAMEAVYRGFALGGEPPMTRFLAVQLGRSHWFDIAAARRDLGYTPRVDMEEGLKRTFAVKPAPQA